MKSEQSIKENLGFQQLKTSHSIELVKELISCLANEKDERINNQLLKELVMNYSLAERDLLELNQLKNKFLGIAAHDLRNPLSSIQGFCSILMDESMGELNEEQSECLSIINNASSSMLDLVNELLDVSVIESGKLALKFESSSLNELLENKIRQNAIISQKKNITIHPDLAELPELVFDRNRIGQVVDNLISNAIKFSPFESNIYIELKRDGNTARISVRDEGPGISPGDQAKLFGEFQKLSARPTGEEKSTGLGLAIVKKIIEAHRGTIEVDSRLGEGSTFSFALPLT